MKSLKKLTALFIIFVFVMSPILSFASSEPTVVISDLGYFLDMYSAHSFKVIMSEECISAEVYVDGTLAEALTAGREYVVTLAEGTFQKIGESVVSVEADFGDGTVSASQTVRIFPAKSKTEILYQDFTGTSDAMAQIAQRYNVSDYDASIWNHSREFGRLLGFNNGISTTNLTTYEACGFMGKEPDDAAFAVEHPSSAGATKNIYFEYSFVGDGHNINGGILEISFDLYMNSGDNLITFLWDNNDSTSISGDTIGTAGKWSRVSIIYDLDNLKWYVNGYERDISENFDSELKSTRIRLYPKAGQTMAIDNIKIDWYEVKNTKFSLVTPSNGDTLTSHDAEVKFSALGATSVKAYIDGELCAEENDIDTESSVFNISDIEYGRRELKLVAEYPDNSTKTKTVYFNVSGSTSAPLGMTDSDTINNFNAMSSGEYADISSLTRFIKNHGGWKSTMPIKRIAGVSGYAPLFEVPHDEEAQNESVYLTGVLKSSASSVITKGKLVMDFDYMIKTTSDDYRLFSYGLWSGNGYTLVSDGKLCGTDFVLTPGNWYHFNMIYDTDNGKWDVSVDGTALVIGESSVNSPFVTGRTISFSVMSHEKTAADIPAGFALDNVRIYNEVYMPNIVDMHYTMSGESFALSDNKLPETASSVSLNLSENISFADADDIVLYIDGTEETVSSAFANGNTVTVSLPQIFAGSVVKIVIKDSVAEIPEDISVVLNVL